MNTDKNKAPPQEGEILRRGYGGKRYIDAESVELLEGMVLNTSPHITASLLDMHKASPYITASLLDVDEASLELGFPYITA